ncbi:ETS-related transcription factor Elf-3-like isoform X2 [Sipha flava]|uniref:ETS-related transcription factor Elf-3-like isoform X2 n=1 Tax=Sipha flava TaxID=143950 RepID=A0A8B8G241_9HEMI|nr:ETS-related transcription factor Elf-3-like isoform X2 [Sipha flava]
MMWALNDVNIVNSYESNDFCVPDDYTLSSQWDFDNGYTNYSENEIDLATVLMNLKEDYPAHSSDEGTYYPTTNGGEQQQWQFDPSDQHQHHHGQQRVFTIYDSLQVNSNQHVRPTDGNYLLPAVLDDNEENCHLNASIKKKRAGRPRGTKVKRSKAEPKLSRIWEFIRDLLLNSQYCPTYICWENYEEGRFRFVQSDKVAKLWGKFKRNERMNYEKFSRAMRYYYKTGVLLPVQGKRLVYKFGPKATGWHTNNPNFKYTF